MREIQNFQIVDEICACRKYGRGLTRDLANNRLLLLPSGWRGRASSLTAAKEEAVRSA